jgi:DNA-binding PadR family transcriptional regulator
MLDFDQCACAGINLDKMVQPTILLFLAEQDLHGYGLIHKLTDSPMFKGEKPDPTGIYRFLKSMEERRLVVSSWDIAETGPPKKVYRITGEGEACLQRWTNTLREYLTSIETLVAAADRILESRTATGVEIASKLGHSSG